MTAADPRSADAQAGQAAPAAPADVYRERQVHFQTCADVLAARSRRYSRARLATAALIAAGLVLIARGGGWWPGAMAGFGVGVFVWLVVRHDRIEREYDTAVDMVALNRQGLARLDRAWNELPPSWSAPFSESHPFAADLDLFGQASLVQILGPVRTPTGRWTLAQWLLHGSDSPPDEIQDRQAAVKELVPALDLRQRLAALARALPNTTSGESDVALPGLVRWAESPSGLSGRAWVAPVAVALTIVTLAGALGALVGVVTGGWWILTGTLGWVLRWRMAVPIEAAFSVTSTEQAMRPWSAVIDHLLTGQLTSPLLAEARRTLERAPASLRSLEQLVALADVRHSAWVFVPLQTLTLWDLHTWRLIERWRAKHGHGVRQWLDAVGRLDAASGLASLAYEHPQWTFPDVEPSADRIEGRAVGHPLLSDAVRVSNDVVVGPPGRFLLITGSNMSGKSTLLRAIGLNVVLAHAGGPACAAAFRMPRLVLHTSMRVSDSLELGLSLFMASLVRLQQIVDAARHASPDRRVCFLLDEVLQGTNSAERQIAVRTVVDHLLRCDAIGVVTTHDLELAHDAAFTARADSFHLQETLSGTQADVVMTFDYRLRPGPAHAGNALQLLRMLGLVDSTATPR